MDRVPSNSVDTSFLHLNAFNSDDSLPSSNHFPDLSNYDFDDSFNTSPFLSVSSETNDSVSAFNYASTITLDDRNGGVLAVGSEQDGVLPGNDSPANSDDSSSSDPILKFISQMLMEEKMEEMPWVFPGDFALQDTERSFHDLLDGNPLPLVSSPVIGDEIDVTQLFMIESPNSNFSGTCSSTDQSSVGTSIGPPHLHGGLDLLESNNYVLQQSASFPSIEVPQVNNHYSSELAGNGLMMENSQVSSHHSSELAGNGLMMENSQVSSHHSSELAGNGLMMENSAAVLKNMFSDAESVLQFNKGVEEAKKFLPDSSKFLLNFDNSSSRSGFNRGNVKVGFHEEVQGGSRGRKVHQREEGSHFEKEESARMSKQSASNVKETEFADWFDKVLLMEGRGNSLYCSDACQQTADHLRSNGSRKKRGNKSSVDLRSLLVLCAQAVSTYDLRTANELLKQIRHHSSPDGDGSERLAHYFANGLEARLSGTTLQGGTMNYFASIATKRVSVAEVLRSYHLYLSSCPFKKFPIIYGNCLISKMAEKASVLHIIDFGIALGFQWPILIQQLGERTKEGHLPLQKLRITGIELPQPGFRPAEKIEETGRRLAMYCHRFGVPFEFNAIPSRNWEKLRVEDLKVERNEMVAVNSLIRLKDLSDEEDEEDSPRDAVLNLIRKIKPDVFVHSVSNGSYNAPFFVTRFKEALFHLSSIFDMFESTIASPGNNEMRVVLEREFYGREIMNVVACEGDERVDRPESYKQWGVRHVRAGFKQVKLSREIMDMLGVKLKRYYHKDFVVDEDGNWMLLGWKGRIMYAAACWVPA